MPPLPVIPDVFRVALNWSGNPLLATNVLHFESATGTALGLANALKTYLTTPANNPYVFTAGDVGLLSIDVLPLDGSSATTSVSGGTIVGQASAGDLIPAGSNVITLRTGIRGRSHRGRVYCPFVRETLQVNGILDSTTATTAANRWAALFAAMQALSPSYTLVVASYKLASADPVTSVTAQVVMATQRRRQSRLR